MSLADIISMVLSGISIICTVLIAIRQSKQNRHLSLYDERYRIILQIQNNEIPDEVKLKMLFPKCEDAYRDWIDLCKKVSETDSDIGEYLDNLARGENRAKNDIAFEFDFEELNSEKNGDASFKAFCKEREITYIPPGQDVSVTRNYYEMKKQKSAMIKKCEEAKKVLIEKLCKPVR